MNPLIDNLLLFRSLLLWSIVNMLFWVVCVLVFSVIRLCLVVDLLCLFLGSVTGVTNCRQTIHYL